MIPSIQCYAVGCNQTIPGDHLFCPGHWATLSKKHRNDIRAASGPDYWPTVLKAVDALETIEVRQSKVIESKQSLETKLCNL